MPRTRSGSEDEGDPRGARTYSAISLYGGSAAVLLMALRSGYPQGCRRQGEVTQNVGCLVFQRDEL
jgi:hypothetical protein